MYIFSYEKIYIYVHIYTHTCVYKNPKLDARECLTRYTHTGSENHHILISQ